MCFPPNFPPPPLPPSLCHPPAWSVWPPAALSQWGLFNLWSYVTSFWEILVCFWKNVENTWKLKTSVDDEQRTFTKTVKRTFKGRLNDFFGFLSIWVYWLSEWLDCVKHKTFLLHFWEIKNISILHFMNTSLNVLIFREIPPDTTFTDGWWCQRQLRVEEVAPGGGAA